MSETVHFQNILLVIVIEYNLRRFRKIIITIMGNLLKRLKSNVVMISTISYGTYNVKKKFGNCNYKLVLIFYASTLL